MIKPSTKSMHTYLDSQKIDNLENMTTEELTELYTQRIKKRLSDFQNLVSQEGDELVSSIKKEQEIQDKIVKIQEKAKKIHGDVKKIYEILDEFIESFSINELMFFISIGAGQIPSSIIEKIIHIKYYEHRFICLEKIKELLKDMPEYERQMLIEKYASMNEDGKIHEIYKKLLDHEQRAQIIKVSTTKLELINNFAQEELKDQYTSNKQKASIIGQIRALTRAYSRESLRNMSLEQLYWLHESIKEQSKT